MVLFLSGKFIEIFFQTHETLEPLKARFRKIRQTDIRFQRNHDFPTEDDDFAQSSDLVLKTSCSFLYGSSFKVAFQI